MERPPEVSVVVATRDRPQRLASLIDSLRSQTLAADRFEVVVVDDGSDSETVALLERERELGGMELRVVRRERPGGPATARNEGWRLVRAPLVAFTDDDCVAAPGWLAAGLAAFRERPDAVVQGRTDPVPAELDRWGPFSHTLRIHTAGPNYQTCNIFYPKELLERLGGFEEAFGLTPGGEDTDLAWRAIAAGAPVVFADDAQVFHAVTRLGPLGKLRLAARWTRTVQMYKRHPELRRAHLTFGVFWGGSHYLLVRAIIGVLLPRSLWPLARWLAYPYVWHLVRRGREEGGGPLLAPYRLVYDLVELVTVVRGAVRYRTFVL